MPLLKENDFLPDLDAISEDVAKRSKIMHINYPNNPTGAVCDKAFYEKVIDFAKKYDIIVCADAAYTEMSFDGYEPISFLEKLYFDCINGEWVFQSCFGDRIIDENFHTMNSNFSGAKTREAFYDFVRIACG